MLIIVTKAYRVIVAALGPTPRRTNTNARNCHVNNFRFRFCRNEKLLEPEFKQISPRTARVRHPCLSSLMTELLLSNWSRDIFQVMLKDDGSVFSCTSDVRPQ